MNPTKTLAHLSADPLHMLSLRCVVLGSRLFSKCNKMMQFVFNSLDYLRFTLFLTLGRFIQLIICHNECRPNESRYSCHISLEKWVSIWDLWITMFRARLGSIFLIRIYLCVFVNSNWEVLAGKKNSGRPYVGDDNPFMRHIQPLEFVLNSKTLYYYTNIFYTMQMMAIHLFNLT